MLIFTLAMPVYMRFLEQKVLLANSEADEVQKEIKETKKNSEKLIDTLRVRPVYWHTI